MDEYFHFLVVSEIVHAINNKLVDSCAHNQVFVIFQAAFLTNHLAEVVSSFASDLDCTREKSRETVVLLTKKGVKIYYILAEAV